MFYEESKGLDGPRRWPAHYHVHIAELPKYPPTNKILRLCRQNYSESTYSELNLRPLDWN